MFPSFSCLRSRARGRASSLARPRACLGSSIVCAALLLSSCDDTKSGPRVDSAGDASFADAGAASADAALSEPTAATARDAASSVSPTFPDAASGPARTPPASSGDAGVTVAPDAAVSGSLTPDASQSAPPIVADGSVPDAGVSVVTRAGWGDQPCDRESSKPGCNDESLALCICRGPDASGGNEFCCTDEWSYLCVDGVAALPECKFTTTKCCEAHPTDGCEDKTVEQCMCAEVGRQKQEEMAAGRDPALVHDCCTQGWTDFCAILAHEVCGAGCANAD